MAKATWVTAKEGIRYREHPTRKHGVKHDRYYTLRYYLPTGERVEESLGWASKKGWTTAKAAKELAKLKANHATGTGPRTLQEKRQLDEDRRAEEAMQKKEEARTNITFAEIFIDHYLPVSQANKRSEASWKREEQLYRLWIAPQFGNKPMRAIAPIHLERIKKTMQKAGRAPRSIQYMLATTRQVFNHAIANGLYFGQNPAAGKGVKRPKVDNRRNRYLNDEESTALLCKLAKRSTDSHNIALLSLQTGARAGEIFSLTWGNIDPFSGTILLKDTKSNKNRHLYMTDAVKKMFLQRKNTDSKKTDLIFPDKMGNKRVQISKTFYRVVDEMGLNIDVTDRRDKVTFHTLRHTYASSLVRKGVDIYTVKELLGHSSITLTERYSHLSESVLKEAAMKIQADWPQP